VMIFGLSFSCDTCLSLSEDGYRLYREAGNREAMEERMRISGKMVPWTPRETGPVPMGGTG